ncbi:excinuclease [Clostridium sp.]|uniref:excinuclease n=1 Tax=Clostridium sp. TaxID=1506 RepID=UPI002FCA630E
MLCERCNNNKASIHLIKVIKGEKTGMWLCEDCAKEFGESQLTELLGKEKFSLSEMLNNIFDMTTNELMKDNICKACGTTYTEFKEKGLLGCSKCYKYFTADLNSKIKEFQGEYKHKGKIPKRAGELISKNKNLQKLKEDLRKAIVIENYEEAAVIRDEIKILEEDLKGEV